MRHAPQCGAICIVSTPTKHSDAKTRTRRAIRPFVAIALGYFLLEAIAIGRLVVAARQEPVVRSDLGALALERLPRQSGSIVLLRRDDATLAFSCERPGLGRYASCAGLVGIPEDTQVGIDWFESPSGVLVVSQRVV